MRNDLKQTFDTIFDYIEDHITEKLTLEDIADYVNISKFHLHRLFRTINGKPLGEYIRARKIARSLEQLLDTSIRIIEISQHYGFEHEQSYIRSFKKAFGTTPFRYRNYGVDDLKITEKMSAPMISSIQGGCVFAPFYVRKPAFKLIGRRSTIRYSDNELFHAANTAGNRFYSHDFHHIKNRVHPHTYIGLTRETNDLYSTYLPSAEVSSLEQAAEGWDWDEVPAHKYAVFRFVGDVHPSLITIDHLDQIWTFIDDFWQQHSGYTKSEPYYFEWIDGDLAREDYGELDIYIPVTQTNLSLI